MTVEGRSFAMSGRNEEEAVRGARLLAGVQGVHVGQVLHSEVLTQGPVLAPGIRLDLFEVVLEECGDEDEVRSSIHSAHMEGREEWSVPDCGKCESAWVDRYSRA